MNPVKSVVNDAERQNFFYTSFLTAIDSIDIIEAYVLISETFLYIQAENLNEKKEDLELESIHINLVSRICSSFFENKTDRNLERITLEFENGEEIPIEASNL